MTSNHSPAGGVRLLLVVTNPRGQTAIRPSERTLRVLADGQTLAVSLDDQARAVRLITMPGRNHPAAFVDQRLPGRIEPLAYGRPATERDLDAASVSATPSHVVKALFPSVWGALRHLRGMGLMRD